MNNTSSAQPLNWDDCQNLLENDAQITASLERVARLDFSMLKRKLGEEKGWSPEYQNEVEALYCRFLSLSTSLIKTGRSVQRGRLMNSGMPISWTPRRTNAIAKTFLGNTCTIFPISVCAGRRIEPTWRKLSIRVGRSLSDISA